jgi:hypothetical protein
MAGTPALRPTAKRFSPMRNQFNPGGFRFLASLKATIIFRKSFY